MLPRERNVGVKSPPGGKREEDEEEEEKEEEEEEEDEEEEEEEEEVEEEEERKGAISPMTKGPRHYGPEKKNSHLIIFFPMSEGVSEGVSERAKN